MPFNRSKAIFDQFVPQIGVTPLPDLLSGLFAKVAALLNVERVGYSRMEPDFSAIQQEIQFLLSRKQCDSTGQLRLLATDYPNYFAALNTPSSVIISHDVMRDERLKEFREGYFKPLGITSMLDVPVHRSGQLYGVICHEQVGPARRWTDNEVDLARSSAHLVALAIETDHRQKAEGELRLALQREQEVVEMKTNFVNLVSHEFRTPLGVIVSAADILESYFDRLKPEQRTGHLHDIRYSAQQMAGLMEEVLLLGKVESGRMNCRREALDLPDFCERIVDEQLSATGRKCPLELKLNGVAGAAQGDAGLLRHIFANLVSNAVKYSPADSKVRFYVHRDGDHAMFEIEDHGIGIVPADHEHLFTAFHRGKNVGHTPGTGLGLAIVKRCVALHDGTISFKSAVGQGTTFTVRLKLFEKAEINRREKAQRTPKKTKK
jgi:signal transduction histidine kinase